MSSALFSHSLPRLPLMEQVNTNYNHVPKKKTIKLNKNICLRLRIANENAKVKKGTILICKKYRAVSGSLANVTHSI